MAKKVPLPHYKHFESPFLMNMRYRDDIDFNISLTSANYSNSLFSDKWGHWNDMYIGTTSPNGYVLGNPIPELAGRTFSLTGTDAARFSVGSSTGIITLADNSGLTVGTLSINLVASDLGSFAISVPVVSAASSIMFVDPVNGNDSNSGREPHLPKLTYNPPSLSYPQTHCIKRGTTLSLTAPMDFSNNNTFKGYGNPSLDRWKLQVEGGHIHQIRNARKGDGVSPQGCSNVAIYDCELLGGAAIQRGIDVYNVSTTMIVKRCYFASNISHSNSAGIKVSGGTTNFVFRWNETSTEVYGDGCYITSCNKYDVAFNILRTPNGTAGDCLQVTDELNYAGRCFDGYIHHNILLYNNPSTSSKGNMVIGGTDYVTIEHNLMPRGNYFNLSIGSCHSIVRHNYFYDATMSPTNNNESCIGYQSDGYTNSVDIYDNYLISSNKVINISTSGTAWQRDDNYINANTIALGVKAMRSTVASTSDIQGNIFCSSYLNDYERVGAGSNVSLNTGSITSFTTNGDGTGYFTTTADNLLSIGDTATVTTASVPTDYTVIGKTQSTRFTVTSAMGTDATARTWERKKRYATQNITGNIAQSGLGTALKAMPTLSGTCQDGQTITATYNVPAGHTVTREWLINGRAISGQTGTTLSIPALSSADTDINGCRTGAANNTAKLSFRLCVIDPNGIKSYVMGIWSDKQVYKTIVA